MLALVGVLEQRIATLEEKANKNSTNSSKPHRPRILLRSSGDLPLLPRARNGAGNPVTAVVFAPWFHPNNFAR